MIRNDIQSELSHAYLHAVASKIGASCRKGDRHEDNRGIDAVILYSPNNPDAEDVRLDVQLKSKKQAPKVVKNGFISYSLQGINRYNDLRLIRDSVPRILVVLFLPENEEEWLEVNEDALMLRKCAYWVSLRGAPASNNENAETVYIPSNQLLTPAALLELLDKLSRMEKLNYQIPPKP